MVRGGIGLVGYDSLHFVVENIERSRAFYKKLDFNEVARAGDELVARSGQQSVVFGAGDGARLRLDAHRPAARRPRAT